MNLNKTWKLCLSMWRWIAEQCRKYSDVDVRDLKKEWLQKHGFKNDKIGAHCFFCQYNDAHPHKKDNCNCPARKVDREFNCMDADYDFYHKPIAFYNKLRALNRKRNKVK